MNYPTVIVDQAEGKSGRTEPTTPVSRSLIQQCKAIDAAKRHDRANERFLARLSELLAVHKGAA
jgi:hypothetical protein